MDRRPYELLTAIESALGRCAAGPGHDALIRIFAVRREGRHLVVERERPDGVPLADVLRQRRALPLPVAMCCLRPLAAAVEHVLANDLPAVDLSVQSVIVQTNIDPPRLHLPKAPPRALTALDQLKAGRDPEKTMQFDPLQITPQSLLAPSLADGIAALGALAFELLSGRPAPATSSACPPIAQLSPAGNLCLARSFREPATFASPAVFADTLAAGGRSDRAPDETVPPQRDR